MSGGCNDTVTFGNAGNETAVLINCCNLFVGRRPSDSLVGCIIGSNGSRELLRCTGSYHGTCRADHNRSNRYAADNRASSGLAVGLRSNGTGTNLDTGNCNLIDAGLFERNYTLRGDGPLHSLNGSICRNNARSKHGRLAGSGNSD